MCYWASMANNEFNVADERREYTHNGRLHRVDLPSDPLTLFTSWLKKAYEARLVDPTAMCVATVDSDGQPFQRVVLLKDYGDRGMVFYTNLESRKALHLAKNSRISLLFPWHELDRQVIFLGKAERLATEEVKNYFTRRPRDSQIAAWVSHQSASIANRGVLESQFIELEKKFRSSDVPVPDFWGGFRVVFDSVEFWQGGTQRLHDRFVYQRKKDLEGTRDWKIYRLAP